MSIFILPQTRYNKELELLGNFSLQLTYRRKKKKRNVTIYKRLLGMSYLRTRNSIYNKLLTRTYLQTLFLIYDQ